MGRKPKGSSPSFIGRIFRSILSVGVLSALLLGIVYFTRFISTTNSSDFASGTAKVASLLHLPVKKEQVGKVAGDFVERISQTNIGTGAATSRVAENSATPQTDVTDKIAIFADVHDDADNLNMAISQAKDLGAERFILLGDLTDYGDIESLQKIKSILDDSGIPYYALPGDHDLADSVSVENFIKVFGQDHYKFTVGNKTFLLLDNAANFTKIDSDQMNWFNESLDSADFVMVSQPLFVEGLLPPFNRMYMGSTRDTITEDAQLKLQKDVLAQRDEILSKIRAQKTVEAVIAGDHHLSNKIEDTSRSDLVHYVVGAVTKKLNEYPQKALQTPRFSILSLQKDGGYKLDDIVIK